MRLRKPLLAPCFAALSAVPLLLLSPSTASTLRLSLAAAFTLAALVLSQWNGTVPGARTVDGGASVIEPPTSQWAAPLTWVVLLPSWMLCLRPLSSYHPDAIIYALGVLVFWSAAWALAWYTYSTFPVLLSRDGISGRWDGTRRARCVRWWEVEEVRWVSGSRARPEQFRLRGPDGVRLAIGVAADGIGDFARLALQHLPLAMTDRAHAELKRLAGQLAGRTGDG